ncbi:hypothetical protein CR66_01505 [Campylobacter mucosalis]|uniref:Uncharacterized protein n=2 Tax=Campylobacter mucosalis TaxID=202 RepID=A0A6G5QGN9_9BACT|nr:hypothetical protein [Campylobacter mucosalis]KEA46548.1 hypothetical protein CR66_01505 [Campylobacter mucosalis]QCD44411.1 hypothetical protein CMUC_0612 [Campylobacter mucosalis CCUG 21559]QCD44666.1 hypothetical protein CMUC_0877 [Campylobacter mucosalis CCUG 21559]QKF62952.1 hypothetical protein CMCT_0813 [Campylobacter mucosalis]
MSEILELKNEILELKFILSSLLPKSMSISEISAQTGKSRQTLTAFVKSNLEPKKDFWQQNGKIMLSQTAALKIIRRYNEK